jgi:hypothetical protein
MMSTTVDYQMTGEHRRLLTDLRLSDEATQGRPQLPDERVELARDYLSLLLTDVRAEMAHIDLLQEFYRTKFYYPLSRRFWDEGPRPSCEVGTGFRHNRFLPEEKARAVAERGPGILSSDELAELLLNPFALWDLADLIDCSAPAYWLPRMEQDAQENWERHRYNVPIPGVEEADVERLLKQRQQGARLTECQSTNEGGNTVCQMTPPVREAEFSAVDTADEEEIKRRFNGFVRQLHSYLNQLPCLRDLQNARRRWTRPRETEPFGTFATQPKHWYTYHHGGRKEAHFDIGLCPSYLRVGLGFEFTLKKGGDPTVVGLAYTCFVNVVKADQSLFERFVADNHLEIEWSGQQGASPQYVPTGEMVSWLLNPPQEPVWLFVGRFLRRGQDSAILEDAGALGKVMEAVLCGFRPIWERTELMAHAK